MTQIPAASNHDLVREHARIRLRSRILRRRDVFIWAAAILFLNHLYSVIKGFPSVSLEAWLADLGAIGIFQYLAWYVIFRLLAESERVPEARPRDLAAVIVFCLPVFLPAGQAIWIAATAIAAYAWWFNAGDRKLRAAAIVLAALSVQELWGHIFFNLIAFHLLRAEAAAVGAVLDVLRPGTEWRDNVVTGPNGYGIMIINSCSSFHNLSLALLCWVTVSRMWRQDWRRRDFAFAAVVGITMILFNVVRLCLMGWNVALYHFWHDGLGAELYAIAASLTVLAISLYAARPDGRPA
jgi:exosortase/archaeosortase family protein